MTIQWMNILYYVATVNPYETFKEMNNLSLEWLTRHLRNDFTFYTAWYYEEIIYVREVFYNFSKKLYKKYWSTVFPTNEFHTYDDKDE